MKCTSRDRRSSLATQHVTPVYDADNHRRVLVRGKNNLAKRDDRSSCVRKMRYFGADRLR
jgi:hypothetical protein